MSTANELFTTIIPTYEEVKNIGQMIGRLSELYSGMNILVMDDGSKDGTVQAVEDIASRDPHVRIVVRDGRVRGLTASVVDGILITTTPFYLVMDADFQHPPEVLKDMMLELDRGAGMVIGKRHHKQALKGSRRVSSDAAQTMAHLYLRLHRQPHPQDIMSGLFGSHTKSSQEIIEKHGKSFESKGYKVLFDLLKFVPKDCTVKEVEYQFGNRRDGASKLSPLVITSILRQCGVLGKMAAALANTFILKRSGQVMLLSMFVLLLVAAVFISA
ncbi:MAG: glycosyltransferase [Methanomassiliicoccus sp.]|nr:glycosyltransferase [Methanomassiliicoccus sp.]